jgi:hypothetical protein
VIVDTAGRLQTKANLMAELEKMRRTASRVVPDAPHEVLLVLDATTGQNGLEQARKFTEFSGVTGIVLTKLDGTAKGGIVVAIARELNLPIRFVGVGEKWTTCCRSTPSGSSSRCSRNEEPIFAGSAGPGAPGPRAGEPQPARGRRAGARRRSGGPRLPYLCRRTHAEAAAIEQAGDKARGATLYINLEPCSHQGRTGPCAEAVVAGGREPRGGGHGRPEPAGGRARISAAARGRGGGGDGARLRSPRPKS